MTLQRAQSLQLVIDAERAADRLVEVITRRQVDRLINPLELKLQATLATLFKRQGNALLRAFGPIRRYFRETLPNDFDRVFDDATLDTSDLMLQALETAIKGALVVGGKSLIRDFQSDVVFSLTNPRAVAYTERRAAEMITGIDGETKDTIRKLVVAAAANGTSYSELARQIKTRFTQFAEGVPQKHIRSRAELVAITEVGQAYQTGNFVAAHQMQDAGLAIEKQWHNVGDKRVSEGCKENSRAGYIDLTVAFPSGHDHPLRFPGCRCTAQYRRKR